MVDQFISKIKQFSEFYKDADELGWAKVKIFFKKLGCGKPVYYDFLQIVMFYVFRNCDEMRFQKVFPSKLTRVEIYLRFLNSKDK